jgi:hypothetical protein
LLLVNSVRAGRRGAAWTLGSPPRSPAPPVRPSRNPAGPACPAFPGTPCRPRAWAFRRPGLRSAWPAGGAGDLHLEAHRKTPVCAVRRGLSVASWMRSQAGCLAACSALSALTETSLRCRSAQKDLSNWPKVAGNLAAHDEGIDIRAPRCSSAHRTFRGNEKNA